MILISFWIWSAASWTAPTLPEGWKGVDLDLGQSLGRDASLDRQRVLIAIVVANASDDTSFTLLPESALGFSTLTVERLWREALRGSNLTVIAGAAVLDGDVRQCVGGDLGRSIRNSLSTADAGSGFHVAAMASSDW